MKSNDFQRNIILDDFPDLLMTFGIDLGSLFKRVFHEISSFFFDIEFCIDFLQRFGPKINQNGFQNILCGHPFWLPKSALAPKATFGCTLVAFRLPFACFELHLNRFGLHFVTFCVRLATFRVHVGTFSLLRLPFGTLFAPFFCFS